MTGVVASARWLPDTTTGMVGGIAFLAVCGLLGAALSIAGLHIYSIVRETEHVPGDSFGLGNGDIVAGGIRNILLDSGTLVGLAGIVYMLASRRAMIDSNLTFLAEGESPSAE